MKSKLLIIILLFYVIFGFSMGTHGQTLTNSTFGKGITVTSIDTSFSMKFSTRIQNRYEGTLTQSDDPDYTDKFYLRRARLKFDGYVFSPKVVYKIELDVVNAEVLDAVLKWNFHKNLSIWFGQTKLPGNRERVISSQKLQFVDRSLVNSKYNLDRDQGIQLRHHFSLGNMILREMFSVSIGEGKNYNSTSQGNDYTGRIELLPLGKFSKKGDYFSGDLAREEKPKLAIGFTYGINDNAVKSKGQTGDVLTETRDLNTIFGDVMFKVKGLSIMGEYASKTTLDGSAAILDTSGNVMESFYAGSGINAQIGYLLKNNWELAYRYTQVTPEKVTNNNSIKQYTLGISKYIAGHNLKVQSDVSLTQEDSKDNKIMYRLQVEMSF